MNQWISVNVAVPPDSRDVLVVSYHEWESYGKKHDSTQIHIAQRIVFQKGHVKWRCSKGTGFIETPLSQTKIIYWMPLPEPPK